MSISLRFCSYEASASIPNIVVDGSPNAATVLTLTHWPGIEQPNGLGADLSAQMAFKYLDAPAEHAPAQVVTNNHFDQDGLVGLHALIDPERSIAHQARLIDVAAAGDFATYTYRESAQASMAIWAYAQPDRSPLGSQLEGPYDAASTLLYETLLPLLIPMIEQPADFRDLWAEEDNHLTQSEQAISSGQVTIEEVADIDLAVVTIRSGRLHGGHRFASDRAELIHPMAINNATTCCRLLIMQGHEYLYMDRYETWVQYRSRLLPQRVDLAPLAERLDAQETGAISWSTKPASSLSPSLRSSGDSSISNGDLTRQVIAHLRSSPMAWNPYPSPSES